MKKPSEIILERVSEIMSGKRFTYNSLSPVDKAILDFLDEQDRINKMPPNPTPK